MKYKILLISLIVSLLTGCKDAIQDPREFPIIRTLPAHVDESGATFRAELLQKGEVPTTSYGFLWSTSEPNITESQTIILGEDVSPGIFQASINDVLAGGLVYQIRAFATYSGKTVYGNVVSFISKGCKKCPWSLEVTNADLSKGFTDCYGSANDEYGHILFENFVAYTFNPENSEISQAASFPHTSSLNYGGIKFTSIKIGSAEYFFSGADRTLQKLETGVWSLKSTAPFSYSSFGGYYQGLAISGSIYILSTSKSYMYNMYANLWQSKTVVPSTYSSGYSIGGTQLQDRAYVIRKDKTIWEYVVSTDSWKLKTTFPGVLKDDGHIISFSHDNLIYFGLSHYDYWDSQPNWMDRKFWSYDPVSNVWNSVEDFPTVMSRGTIFFFSLKDKLYIGNGRSGKYNIWKFDPSKSAD